MKLRTTVDIDAPPAAVWRVLVDFDRYGEWNPFLRVAGQPNLGARLSVTVRPPTKGATRFRPTVVAAAPNRELAWVGHLFVPGLYDGEHRFTLEALDGGRTRVTQSETFDGALVRPINWWLGAATLEGFEAMNVALKTRAESRVAKSVASTERNGHDLAA